jgi:hypothetical protein
MKKRYSLLILFLLSGGSSFAQNKPVSERMAATVMDIWADSLWTGRPFKWTYDQGVVLEGIAAIWRRRKVFQLHQKKHGPLCKRRWYHPHL